MSGTVTADGAARRVQYDAAMARGQAVYQDVLDALAGRGMAGVFIQTGGMCAAREVRLETGHTLLLTDATEPLSWHRCDHDGWGVGTYAAEDSYEAQLVDGPAVDDSTEDGTVGGLLALIDGVLAQWVRGVREARQRPA